MKKIVKPAEWHSQGQYFDFRYSDIFYCKEEKENLPKLILLHGFPSSSWDWYKMWDSLADNFSVYAPDLLGFGFSAKPYPHPYSIPEQAKLVSSMMSKLHLNDHKIHFLVHDYSVSIGQELLYHSLEGKLDYTIGSMCFLNGGLFPETHQALFTQKLLGGPLGPFFIQFFGKGKLRKSFDKVFGPETKASSEEIDALWDIINFNSGKRCLAPLLGYMKDRITYREPWLNAMRKSGIPLKFINGPEDPVSGRHAMKRVEELLEKPDISFLNKIGHYPNLEDPEGVMKAFLPFISSHI